MCKNTKLKIQISNRNNTNINKKVKHAIQSVVF